MINESAKPLSASCLWSLQRDYFNKEGVQAWSGKIPFYVTSNPFIANSYAQMTVAFIRDYLQLHPEAKQQTFYLLELGTGPGQFSFYMVKRLQELLVLAGCGDCHFCYVMTDFTESNLEYWLKQPQLQPFVEQGIVDFAIFNMENDTTLHLHVANKTLREGDIKTPLCLFANYLFDCISHDCFTISNGEIQASWVSVKGDSIENLKADYTQQPADDTPYPEETFNRILQTYAEELIDTHLLFPIAALRAIEHLCQWSNQQLVLIASDKGYSTLDDLDNLTYPQLECHDGCFSVMVNMHAIAEYFTLSGGDVCMTSPREGIKTGLFLRGFSLSDLPQTSLMAEQGITQMSPADYLACYHHIINSVENADLTAIVSYLNLSHWDPYLYQHLSARINAVIDDADYYGKQFLSDHADDIANHFYDLPEAYDVFFELGVLFHALEKFDRALHFYQQSERYFEPEFPVFYNIGLCHYYLDDYPAALALFKKALIKDPASTETLEWIKKVE